MTGSDALIVRPLSLSDRTQWGDLWTAYLAFYETELSDTIYDTHFARMMGDEPYDFKGLVAESEGARVARFNLSWILEGEPTGDGEVPAWAKGN